MAGKFIRKTPEEINKDIGKNIYNLRRRRKISRSKLSGLSGVPESSIKRFETTGNISLLSLSKIALALNLEKEMEELFSDVPYLSIEEVMRENKEH